MTASGTSGHGTELAEYGDLGELGAVVVKSLSVEPGPRTWPRGCTRSAPACSTAWDCRAPGWRRGCATTCQRWPPSARCRREHLGPFSVGLRPGRRARRGRSVVRGRFVHRRPRGQRELSLNAEDRSRMFVHSRRSRRPASCRPRLVTCRWAKLSPNVPDLVEIATGAVDGGADGLTLVNTLLGLALDTESGRPVLGVVAGSPVAPCTRSPYAWCGSADRPSPSCPSSASVACSPATTRAGSCCWPVPMPSRWGPPRSATPGTVELPAAPGGAVVRYPWHHRGGHPPTGAGPPG